MKSILTVVVLLGLLATPAVAGEIFGTLSEGTKAVDAGVKLVISISGKADTTATDKFGSYRFIVKDKGKCTLTAHYKNQSPSVQVVSYDKATRYDLILEAKEGTYSLRRK